MKRSLSNPAKSTSKSKSMPLPTKRRAVATKPKVTRKVSKSLSPKPLVNTASPRSRKPATASGGSSTPVLPPKSKQSQLIHLLNTAAGASMAQMIALTGWQPHTVRGTISGSLRKRLGLNVQCSNAEGLRIYRIAQAAGT